MSLLRWLRPLAAPARVVSDEEDVLLNPLVLSDAIDDEVVYLDDEIHQSASATPEMDAPESAERYAQIIEDVGVVLSQVRDEVIRQGLISDFDIVDQGNGELRVRLVAGDLPEYQSRWSYRPSAQGKGVHVQRIEDVLLEDYLDISEMLYLLQLTSLRTRFARAVLW